MYLLQLHGVPILQQLQMEEALLKVDHRPWCIINQGSEDAIVMGISGHPDKLINSEKMSLKPVPLIRRFSGGGTVYVDHDTLFITFIMPSEVSPKQKDILDWTATIYKPVFGNDFRIQENDYVFRDLKFGGNAQYLRKNRWLHHTSFLWDYCPKKMDYLLMPPKVPDYRNARSHVDFLCRLKDAFDNQQMIIDAVKQQLSQRFTLKIADVQEVVKICGMPHHRSTERMDQR